MKKLTSLVNSQYYQLLILIKDQQSNASNPRQRHALIVRTCVSERCFLLGSVQLDKKEWEAFLEKLTELETKYLRVLRELDEAQARLNKFENTPKNPQSETKEEATPKNVATQELTKRPQEKLAYQPRSMLARISAELSSLRNLSTLQRGAACSLCGHRITHVSRFCEKCGADFGKLTCVCGRDLTASDKFCDHCGRSTAGKS